MTVVLGLYGGLMQQLHGFAPALLRSRAAKGKEDPARFMEKLGQPGIPRPAGALVWFHGVSVGESLSALPVIDRLRAERPDLSVLITTATTTSAELLAKRAQDVIHQYAPLDTPQAVKAFLDHWRPSLAIFIESDIWPNLLQGLTARHIPHALLSARITDKTFRGWQRFRASMRQVLDGYSLIMAQDEASENRIRAMGQTVSARLGARANLKSLGAPLPVDAVKLAALRDAATGRFVFLAASTHAGEDAIITKSVEPYLHDGDLLIIAPRHPLRAAEVRLDLQAVGLRVAQRSRDESLDAGTQVYLADTLGELGLFFSLADITILGGSFLTGIGGHNPLEPARLGKSVITGPDIANWNAIFTQLLDNKAAYLVQGPKELNFLISQLRKNPAAVHVMDEQAFAVSRREDDTLDTVWSALWPLLPAPEHAA